MRVMHRPDLELKKCTECEDLFNTENALQKHFDKYHRTNDDITKGFPEIIKRRKQNFDDIEIVDGEFVNNEELLKSDNEYDPENDSESEEGSESEDWSGNEDEQVSLTKKNKCAQCDSTFKWKSGLNIHVKSQHVGQYKCFECRWSFRTKETRSKFDL